MSCVASIPSYTFRVGSSTDTSIASVGSLLSEVLSGEQAAISFSTLMVNSNNNDRKEEVDITRCGVIAESFLNRIYFSSEEELSDNIALYHFDMDDLKRSIRRKNLVCKVIWAVWEKKLFESKEAAGEFVMPTYEHTFLIDFAAAKNSSGGDSCFAHVIQSAYETYYASSQSVTSEYLWNHLDYLKNLDRRTVLDQQSLSDWIERGLFLDRIAQDKPLKSLEGKDFVGQLISFTGYSYSPEAAISRLNTIKENRV
jgi:hypothetical protein